MITPLKHEHPADVLGRGPQGHEDGDVLVFSMTSMTRVVMMLKDPTRTNIRRMTNMRSFRAARP
jgi:hypothetical protein